MPRHPDRRRRALEALAAESFDVLIVGGGSVGAGIALHAAARGLRVALVERGDFASGTSSRSTKLIHGGVRYLEQALTRADRVEFALVLEALRERAAFFRLAPYLSRRLAILTPTYSRQDRLYYGAGLALYDALAGRASLGRTRYLSAAQVRATFPSVAPELPEPARTLQGGVVYYDGQFDDARLNVMLVLTAERLGATVANYARVMGLVAGGDGRIAGAIVADDLSGADLAVRARVVINAAGPYADELRTLDDPGREPLLRTSSGIHVVVRGDLCPPDTGLLIPRTEDGRVVFILPWLGHTLIGTTDRPAEPDPSPRASAEDVDYLLAHANRYLIRRLDPGDVRSAWSGLRPLVRDPNPRARKGTAQLARTHVVEESPRGLVTVVGGKWTTYRRIATDAVDHVVRMRGLSARPAAAASETPILGADAFSPADLVRGGKELPADIADHLTHSYGDRSGAVAGLMVEGHADRLDPAFPYVEAEVLWAVREEYARRPVDVLARRLRLAFLDRAAAARSLPRAVALMACELGWSPERAAREEAEARADLERSF
jgi:glycerol-3-phosphate dehydrogenase